MYTLPEWIPFWIIFFFLLDRLKCGEFLLLLIGHINGRDRSPMASVHEDIRRFLGEKSASLIWAASQFGSTLNPEERLTALHIQARRVLESIDLYWKKEKTIGKKDAFHPFLHLTAKHRYLLNAIVECLRLWLVLMYAHFKWMSDSRLCSVKIWVSFLMSKGCTFFLIMFLGFEIYSCHISLNIAVNLCYLILINLVVVKGPLIRICDR